jgi:hypothetical protein
VTPKLKENPKEWWKFTAVMALALAVVAAMLQRRKIISREMLFGVIGLLALALLGCALRPKWFRGFYRAGMTISFHAGQVIGGVLLTIFFLAVLTPIGLGLRLLGKDLLRLKRRPGARSYWLSARTTNRFDRQF